MAENASGLIRSSKKLGALGLGSFALAAAFMGLGGATANAEVEEVAPSLAVTSGNALHFGEGGIRNSVSGVARGAGATRSADSGIVHALGEVKDSVKAIVGTCSPTAWGHTGVDGNTDGGSRALAASPQC